MNYDLHVHSKYSIDGYTEPKVIVKTAHKRGLSGVAVTDHNTIQGGLKAKEYETDDLKVIVGSEIETDRGEVIGLFLSEEVKSNTFPEVVQEIKDQNGLVIIPHPFDNIRGNGIKPTSEDIPFVDCVEVYNSRCLLERYNHRASEFAQSSKLNISAGSDAHFAREIGRAGIIVNSEINNPDELLKETPIVFGTKTGIIHLGLTKILKTWRKPY
ncbi:MAG: PHP domain-containing protein [Methanobacteriaceae archaeon]|nr:PHP domain-containing protein [Methanobacteriaceae archaeon]OPY22810.1 MAG: error-prone DNA polymerase [Methanobacterium sp. PtaU1.Bin097]